MKNTLYEVRYACNPTDYKNYDTARIRESFLVPGLMEENKIKLVYSHFDRYIAGGVVPLGNTLALETIPPLRANNFLDRREMGIINIGNLGKIEVDGELFELKNKEALYIGKGAQSVQFSSESPYNPARFYFNSAPAHQSYPTKLVTKKNAEIVEAGAPNTANSRIINKLIVKSVLQTCQLQMGITELQSGNVWNTMPAHTHDRRMEIYFYFDLPKGEAISHFMGPKEETRCVWMQNEEAIISPPWSIHCGAGTSHYSFIWGMCGENLDYTDMDGFAPSEMR